MSGNEKRSGSFHGKTGSYIKAHGSCNSAFHFNLSLTFDQGTNLKVRMLSMENNTM